MTSRFGTKRSFEVFFSVIFQGYTFPVMSFVTNGSSLLFYPPPVLVKTPEPASPETLTAFCSIFLFSSSRPSSEPE